MVFHGPGIDGVDAAVTTQEHTPTLDEQEASLLNILDTTNSPEFSDNGPFYHFRQPFVDLLSAVRNLRDYRGAHPDEDAEMLNLDEAKESSYTRFGLNVKTVRWQDSHNKGVKEILTRRGMKERISSFWNIRRGLRSEDIIIYKHTASQNRGIPALARMIFFQLQFMYQEDQDLEPLVLTDMSFKIESDDPFTVFYTPDSGPSRVTLLRGSAKMTYVFFAQESGVNFRQGQSTEEKRELMERVPLNLEGLLEDPLYLGLFNDECFLVFTVYDKPISSKIVPTIVKCLTIMQKINKKKLAWCLTTAAEWIFGVIVDGPTRTCFMSDIIRLDEESDLDNIFLALAVWGMSPCQDLVQLFA